MKITDLLTTYWSQVILLLMILSYFIKRLFEIESRKVEINHSLFQQNRIQAVNEFLSNYAKVSLMWNQIAIYEILSHKLRPTELDNILLPSLTNLKKSLLELKIYFENEDHKYFENLTNAQTSINGKINELYFDSDKGRNPTALVNDFTDFRDKTMKGDLKRMDELCVIIRKIYKS